MPKTLIKLLKYCKQYQIDYRHVLKQGLWLLMSHKIQVSLYFYGNELSRFIAVKNQFDMDRKTFLTI